MKIIEKEINDLCKIETLRLKVSKYIKKYNIYYSKPLFLISLLLFLISSIFLSIGFSISHLSNINGWIFLIFYSAIYLGVPIGSYIFINLKHTKSTIHTYEKLASIILLIGGIIGPFIPERQMCTYPEPAFCTIIPGEFDIGILISLFLFPLIFIVAPKKIIKIDKVRRCSFQNIEKINTLFKQDISMLKTNIINIQKRINENLELIENTHDWSIERDIINLNEKQLKYCEELILRYKESEIINEDYRVLRYKSRYAFYIGEFEKGIELGKKSINNYEIQSKEEFNNSILGKISKPTEDFFNLRFQYELILELLKTQRFNEAYEIFLKVLYNYNFLKIVDPRILVYTLENVDKKDAARAVKDGNYSLLFKILKL